MVVRADLSHGVEVRLAAHQHTDRLRVLLLTQLTTVPLLLPLLNILERLLVCNIKGKKDCLGPAVVERT